MLPFRQGFQQLFRRWRARPLQHLDSPYLAHVSQCQSLQLLLNAPAKFQRGQLACQRLAQGWFGGNSQILQVVGGLLSDGKLLSDAPALGRPAARPCLEPPALDELRADVPAGLAAAIRRMLAKRPEDRYQTPAEVAQAMAPLQRFHLYSVVGPRFRPPSMVGAFTRA